MNKEKAIKLLKDINISDFYNDYNGHTTFEEPRAYLEAIENVLKYIEQLEKQNGALLNALVTTRTKHNNNKAKYRRKAKRYRNNWNELKEWLKNREDEAYIYTKVLDKMEVIEGGVDNE